MKDKKFNLPIPEMPVTEGRGGGWFESSQLVNFWPLFDLESILTKGLQ